MNDCKFVLQVGTNVVEQRFTVVQGSGDSSLPEGVPQIVPILFGMTTQTASRLEFRYNTTVYTSATVRIVCTTGGGDAVFLPDRVHSMVVTNDDILTVIGVTTSTVPSNMVFEVSVADHSARDPFTVVGKPVIDVARALQIVREDIIRLDHPAEEKLDIMMRNAAMSVRLIGCVYYINASSYPRMKWRSWLNPEYWVNAETGNIELRLEQRDAIWEQ